MTIRALPNMLSIRQEDLGKFTLSCFIEHFYFCNFLYDLGANISMISYAIYKKLELRAFKRTRYLFQLVNGVVKHARGVAKNIVIKVDQFLFSKNFVVVDRDQEELDTHVILIRSFLAISGAIINILEGSITLKVGVNKEPLMCSNLIGKSTTRPSLLENNTWSNASDCLWMIFIHLILKSEPHVILIFKEKSKI